MDAATILALLQVGRLASDLLDRHVQDGMTPEQVRAELAKAGIGLKEAWDFWDRAGEVRRPQPVTDLGDSA